MPTTTERAPGSSVEPGKELELYNPAHAAGNFAFAYSAEEQGQATPERAGSAPETVPEVYTSGTFQRTASLLEQALKQNPRANFDASQWLNSTEGDSDSAVYARILDSFKENGDKPLEPYQINVLRYMQSQIDFNQAQATVDVKNLDEAQAIKVLINRARTKLKQEGVSEVEKRRLDAANRTMSATYARMIPNSGAKMPKENALGTYVRLVESRADMDQIAEAGKELQFAAFSNQQDARTFAILAKHQDSNLVADVQVSHETEDPLGRAKKALAAARSELAAMNARREKRMWLVNFYTSDAAGSAKYRSLHRNYQAASRRVFNLLNPNLHEDASLSNTDRIRRVAEYTVGEARKLDLATLSKYKDINSPLGKLIEKYGNMHIVPKVLLGVGASALAGFATGGLATFGVSGSFMAVGLEASHRKKRAAGADMLKFDVEKLVGIYGENNLSGDNAKQVISALHGAINRRVAKQFENRIENAQRVRAARTVGSYAVASLVGYGSHHIPGGWFDGSHGLLGGHELTHAATPAHPAPSAPHAPAPAPAPNHVPAPAPEIHTGPSHFYAHSNEGWYEVMQNMGIDASHRHDILLKAAPELYKNHLAYHMADGLPGIPNTGFISQQAIDIISHAAGR